MPAFLSIFLQLLPFIPNIIKAVEQLQGPGNGASKLSTAMSLIQGLEPTLGPLLVEDPAKLAIVHNVIGISVSAMNASGMMPQIKPLMPVEEIGSGA